MPGLTAKDIMSAPPRTVSEGSTLAEAAGIMLEKGIDSLLVVDPDGELVGIVTDSDFGSSEGRVPFSTFRAPTLLGHWIGEDGVERIYQEARRRTVVEIMSAPVHTAGPGTPLRKLLELMFRREVKHVPVVEGGRPLGIVTCHDLLKVLLERLQDPTRMSE